MIVLSTCKVHLATLFTDTHTDKYDLKARHSTLYTLTNSFNLRARNNIIQEDIKMVMHNNIIVKRVREAQPDATIITKILKHRNK